MGKIFITGGTGYIGSHTALSLQLLGHKVTLFDNLSNSEALVCDVLEQLSGDRPSFIVGDIRDTRLLKDSLIESDPDVVIHFAGLKAVGQSVTSPVDYFSNNVSGTISLLRAMGECAVRSIIFSSSATVYGDPKYLPIDEEHPTAATNPYARTKLHVEQILKDLAFADPEWRIACLRYFNPVGAHQSGILGENPKGLPNNLMPFMVKVAAGEYRELEIYGGDYETPDGTGVRDYIHVMDLAAGHAAALEFLQRQKGWYAINLGVGRGHSVFEVLRTFERVSGRQIDYRVVGRRPGDVATSYADPSLARSLLNWRATRTLEDMCSSAWTFYKYKVTAP